MVYKKFDNSMNFADASSMEIAPEIFIAMPLLNHYYG